MTALSEAAQQLFGSVAPYIVLFVTVVIWAINKVPGWIANRAGGLPGSPATARYWRARLAESLVQMANAPEGAEHAEFAARIKEARIMVEAHEAKRRLGNGSLIFFWILFGFFAGAAMLFYAISGPEKSLAVTVAAGIFVLAMFVAELLALNTSLAIEERVNALISAGRRGHSDLVRTDPWLVVRQYEEWKSDPDFVKQKRDRSSGDKAGVRRSLRWRRALYGLPVRPRDMEISTDIWSRSTWPVDAERDELKAGA